MKIPNTMFTPYFYESQEIEIALSNFEIKIILTVTDWNELREEE